MRKFWQVVSRVRGALWAELKSLAASVSKKAELHREQIKVMVGDNPPALCSTLLQINYSDDAIISVEASFRQALTYRRY